MYTEQDENTNFMMLLWKLQGVCANVAQLSGSEGMIVLVRLLMKAMHCGSINTSELRYII